jgi:hypothetical protein
MAKRDIGIDTTIRTRMFREDGLSRFLHPPAIRNRLLDLLLSVLWVLSGVAVGGFIWLL